MKKFSIITILISCFFFTSCIDLTTPISETGVPKIISLSTNTIVVNDTLIIYGEFFDTPNKNNYLLISSTEKTTKISSDSVINWQTNKITVKIDYDYSNAFLQVFAFDSLSKPFNLLVNRTDYINEVQIPSGKFLMGSISGNFDEYPVHEVSITNPFFMSKTEVNQRLYQQVMQSNPAEIKIPSLPIYNITFDDAVTFCNLLSEIQGLEKCYDLTKTPITWNKKANGWRLPTEAEWEYACRAGTTTDYPIEDMSSVSWYNINSGMKPHPVADKTPNAFGLFDMNGNVREYCWDFYSASFYSISPSIDPDGPANGTIRVIRGGSFSDGISYLRSPNRKFAKDNGLTGIRIVRNSK